MTFQSIYFILFLLVVWGIYWFIKPKYRWCLLLSAGIFYYATYHPWYVLLLFMVVTITYISARQIEKAALPFRKVILGVTVCFEILILVVFKYLGFLGEICNNILLFCTNHIRIPIMQLVLPIGISFYIFQTLAYVIDVYRGKISAEKHFGYYAASVFFFPIMLAGPIERIPYLVSQFKNTPDFSYQNSCQAFQQILFGYMKKLIIADSLAVLVTRIYADLKIYRGFPTLIAILLYSIEIYCDFSGYSDIAIGVAGLFNIRIRENFRRPYFADSVKEFWRRWHISLTSWFRDYIYIPLGGNRCSIISRQRNIMCVYLLSGLWHGANWTFLLWGAFNGIAQIAENLCTGIKSKVTMPKPVKQIITFVAVSIMWVFFRMETVKDAFYAIIHCFDGIGSIGTYLSSGISLLNLPKTQYGMLGLFLALLFYFDWREEKGKTGLLSGWKLSILTALGMIYYLKYGIDSSTFIYFQF